MPRNSCSDVWPLRIALTLDFSSLGVGLFSPGPKRFRLGHGRESSGCCRHSADGTIIPGVESRAGVDAPGNHAPRKPGGGAERSGQVQAGEEDDIKGRGSP